MLFVLKLLWLGNQIRTRQFVHRIQSGSRRFPMNKKLPVIVASAALAFASCATTPSPKPGGEKINRDALSRLERAILDSGNAGVPPEITP